MQNIAHIKVVGRIDLPPMGRVRPIVRLNNIIESEQREERYRTEDEEYMDLCRRTGRPVYGWNFKSEYYKTSYVGETDGMEYGY